MDLDKLSFLTAVRLKEERKKRGLSHIGLSEALKEEFGINVSKDSLINYEVSDEHHTKAYKNKGMKIEYLLCLAEFYGVSCDYLLGRSDEPHMDATVQSVSEYTGLSGVTVEALHSYLDKPVQRNFIKRFLEDLLVDSNIVDRIPDYLKRYAIAYRVAVSDRMSLTKRKNREESVAIEDGKYVISPDDAADLFLGQAIADAQGEIANIIEQLGLELSRPNSLGGSQQERIMNHKWEIYSEDDA